MTRHKVGSGYLTGGLLGAVVGVGLETQSAPRSGPTPYPGDIERAMVPLAHLFWRFVMGIRIAALILSVILVGGSYWLLGPPRRNA